MNTANPQELTKGEAIILGLEQIREGLAMVNKASKDVDLIRTLVGSNRGAQQLRDVVNANLLKTVIMEMVAARNPKLAPNTVEKVVQDFLNVLFELSKPFDSPKPAEVGKGVTGPVK